MKIGVPKEIKPQENRIGLTPESVKTLVSEGHKVIIENNGGSGVVPYLPLPELKKRATN